MAKPALKALPKTTMHKIDTALAQVRRELIEAMHIYDPMHSDHEGIAVIAEEVDELWAEVKKKPSKRDPGATRNEARQVAAMAVRFMVDRCPEGETPNK